ncbi:nicotinate-nucleotide adenylyltransferase [Bacillaceae bacterium Marseille-Q3522]|nr:nicotinate-nucleotide adenylyltransferase [Bacillaceae bacterium Marseille-Q3522]
MNKIGIIGGTFDPPHIGHLIIANEVKFAFDLDEIWFMPNDNPPHKEKTANVSNEDRINMLKLSICRNPYFKIEPIEMLRAGKSYTYDTMKILMEKYPETKFYFIIGADMIEYLPKWYKINQLIKLVQFIGVKRPEHHRQSPYPLLYVDVPSIDISSSIIRERILAGRTIKYLVHEAVEKYIKENALYEA